MRIDEIRGIARERGIKAGKMKKEELIRNIQREEGNSACYGAAAGAPCPQCDCLWFADCQPKRM